MFEGWADGFKFIGDFASGEDVHPLGVPDTALEHAANFVAGPLLIAAGAARGEAMGIGAEAGMQATTFSGRRDALESARMQAASTASLAGPMSMPIPGVQDFGAVGLPSAPPEMTVNVTVTPGADARERSRAAGQELERQLYQAQLAVGAL